MRKILLFLIFISLVGLVIYLMTPNYKFKYFYSPNGKTCITRVAKGGNDYVYYTYGYYNKYEVPTSYIESRSVSGFGEGYYLYLYWNDTCCTIYNSCGIYDTVNQNNNLKYERIEEYSNQWEKMIKDTTGKSVRDGSFDLFNWYSFWILSTFNRVIKYIAQHKT